MNLVRVAFLMRCQLEQSRVPFPVGVGFFVVGAVLTVKQIHVSDLRLSTYWEYFLHCSLLPFPYVPDNQRMRILILPFHICILIELTDRLHVLLDLRQIVDIFVRA